MSAFSLVTRFPRQRKLQYGLLVRLVPWGFTFRDTPTPPSLTSSPPYHLYGNNRQHAFLRWPEPARSLILKCTSRLVCWGLDPPLVSYFGEVVETWESQSLHLGCRSQEADPDSYPKSPVTTRLSLCFRPVKWVSSTTHFHCYGGRCPHSPGSNENELWSENPLTVSQSQPFPFKLLSWGFPHSWEKKTEDKAGHQLTGLHLAFEVLTWSVALSP